MKRMVLNRYLWMAIKYNEVELHFFWYLRDDIIYPTDNRCEKKKYPEIFDPSFFGCKNQDDADDWLNIPKRKSQNFNDHIVLYSKMPVRKAVIKHEQPSDE
jgi:hypothetical protein